MGSLATKLKSTLFATSPEQRSVEEKKFVRRLDAFLLFFGCISQVIKYLDQQNINNAYVSGMKEDLHLYGNEYNYFTTFFNVAYCIMLIPSQIIMTYVRPSFWLPSLEIGWGVITGLMALVQDAKHVYVLRVFLGLFESSAWPGMMTLFMHWYTPSELAKRMAFYHSCQAVGYMLSGALQAAIMDSLDGSNGIPGWRWLFIINACITVVWGAAGFVMLPDLPNKPNPRAFWFKSTDAGLAMERLARHEREEPQRVTWATVRRTFSGWVVYFIAVLYTSTVIASWGYSFFSLFLKSLENPDGSSVWSVQDINVIPIGGGAINVVFVWIWAILSDTLHSRWSLIVVQAVIGLIPCIAMSVWTSHPDSVPLATAYASYFINYLCLGTAPLIFSWMSDLLPHDPDARSLIVGVAVATYYAIGAWSQVLVWPATQAPYYKHAWQTSIALWTLAIIMTCGLEFFVVRSLLSKRKQSTRPYGQPASDIEGVDGVDSAKNEAAEVEERVSTAPAKLYQ